MSTTCLPRRTFDPDIARYRIPQHLDKAGNSHLGVPATSKEESDRRHEEILKAGLPAQDLADLIRQLSEQMHTAAEQLQFELAARLRDEIRDLKKELPADDGGDK